MAFQECPHLPLLEAIPDQRTTPPQVAEALQGPDGELRTTAVEILPGCVSASMLNTLALQDESLFRHIAALDAIVHVPAGPRFQVGNTKVYREETSYPPGPSFTSQPAA